MAGWGASGVIPKGSMQLAAGICGVGVVFSFFQGRSVPARLEELGRKSGNDNNERLQKMLDDLKGKTTQEKLNDAMNAMANLHEVNRYNAEVYLKSAGKDGRGQ